MRFEPAVPSIYGETLESLSERLCAMGEPSFRAHQIMDWLYKKRIASWEGMANLPKELRRRLGETFQLQPARRTLIKRAGDITEKLLLELGDRSYVESVLIRYPQRGVGQQTARKTVCVSSQVGCAYGCRFCASGLDGWKRDLLASEIVAQLMHVCALEDARAPHPGGAEGVPFDNIVFMGMGEPLANYDNLMRAITIINAEWGMRFGARRITVSTSGLVPQILRLADEPVQFRLAISLHGATDDVRGAIMPINRRYPLDQLIPAAREFTRKHGRMLTLEYILIEDVNDSFDQARELVRIARELHAHVNCIPYNRGPGLPWKRPSLQRQEAFARVLGDAGVSHTIRKEKGDDIDAACGQLRLRKEKAAAGTDSCAAT